MRYFIKGICLSVIAVSAVSSCKARNSAGSNTRGIQFNNSAEGGLGTSVAERWYGQQDKVCRVQCTDGFDKKGQPNNPDTCLASRLDAKDFSDGIDTLTIEARDKSAIKRFVAPGANDVNIPDELLRPG